MVGKTFKVCAVGAGIIGVPVCAVVACQCPELSVALVDNDTDLIGRWNCDADFPISEVTFLFK